MHEVYKSDSTGSQELFGRFFPSCTIITIDIIEYMETVPCGYAIVHLAILASEAISKGGKKTT
jgi:hypothetical protein